MPPKFYRAAARTFAKGAKYSLAKGAAAYSGLAYGGYKSLPGKRKAASRTLTKLRVKRRKPTQRTSDNTPAIHYNHGRPFKISDKFVRMVKQASAAIDTQHFKSTMQMTSNIGQCNYAVPHLLYDPDHIHTINNHLGAVNDAKFIIRNAVSTIQLVNARNSCANLRVYACVARSDVPYKSATYVTPYNYLVAGWNDASLSGLLNDISGTAFTSGAFTTWFKVESVKTIELKPGECKRFTVEDKTCTSINMERWWPGGDQLSIAHGGKTRFLLFQYWGQTVNDVSDTSQVSTDVVKIDCVHTVKYEYQWVSDTNPTAYTSGSLGTVASPEFINENSSAVITGASA